MYERLLAWKLRATRRRRRRRRRRRARRRRRHHNTLALSSTAHRARLWRNSRVVSRASRSLRCVVRTPNATTPLDSPRAADFDRDPRANPRDRSSTGINPPAHRRIVALAPCAWPTERPATRTRTSVFARFTASSSTRRRLRVATYGVIRRQSMKLFAMRARTRTSVFTMPANARIRDAHQSPRMRPERFNV